MAFVPLIYFFYPETRNLSLEQVDRLFTGEKVLLDWKPSMGERQGSFALEATTDRPGAQSTEKGHETVQVSHKD